MNKGEKTGLVPRLRFPEFGDSGEWEEKALAEVADFVNTKISVKELKANQYISTENVLQDFAGIESSNKLPSVNNVTCFGIGDILISNIRPYLKKIWFSNMVGGASNDILVVRAKKINPIFLSFLLKSDEFINYMTAGARGVKMPRGDISLIKRYPIFVPQKNINAKKSEQQKIADCLSSLDDLIAAEDKKLEALRTHKKGLMQKLFPAEGKAMPKWRFPEFRGNGEWEEKKFGELCNFIRGPFGGALKKEIFVNNGYAVYEQSHAIYSDFRFFRYHITGEKYNELKRFSVHADDIIMSCSGTMGKFAIVPSDAKEGVINQALLKLTVKKGIDVKFAKMTLELDANQEKLLSQSAGGAIKNVVAVSQMKEIPLLMPHIFEQQKIADCLSSIDDFITEQAKKIDVLKSHKKGLLQGLFPSIEEVSE